MIDTLQTAGQAFIARFPRVVLMDYVSMVEKEADNEMEYRKMRRTSANRKEALKVAAKRIWDWANDADSYSIDRLSVFVSSHRPACVWAVLVGMESEGAVTVTYRQEATR